MAQETALRRGYLREDFRLFHLKDAAMEQVDWHYHSFHKVLVLLSGHASYTIEGQNYALEPGDVVFVPRGSIHRPEVFPGLAYERYILYVAPEFLRRSSSPGTDLETCFQLACRRYSYVLRQVGSFTQFACWRRCTAPNSPQGMAGPAGQRSSASISHFRHPGAGSISSVARSFRLL